jgi:hypothetical protein
MVEYAIHNDIDAKLDPGNLCKRLNKLESLYCALITKCIKRDPDYFKEVLTDFARFHLHKNTLFNENDPNQKNIMLKEEQQVKIQNHIDDVLFKDVSITNDKMVRNLVEKMHKLGEDISMDLTP